MAFTGSFTDDVPKDLNGILNQLLGEFNTVEAKKKIMPDSFDRYVLHESVGYYVTESTSGFFPDSKSPAYKFCNLIQSLEIVGQSKQAPQQKKKAIEECLKYFEDASYDMTDRINRSKVCYQLRNDKGVNENRYNDRVAALYDMCGELSQKNKVDRVFSMLYTVMFNCAVCASVPDHPPYSFTQKEQLNALENARRAFTKILTNLK